MRRSASPHTEAPGLQQSLETALRNGVQGINRHGIAVLRLHAHVVCGRVRVQDDAQFLWDASPVISEAGETEQLEHGDSTSLKVLKSAKKEQTGWSRGRVCSCTTRLSSIHADG